jgi:hypothetical protein
MNAPDAIDWIKWIAEAASVFGPYFLISIAVWGLWE